jgi:hypothetical protein
MIDLDLEKRLRAAAHASVNAVTVPEPPASLRLLRADVARRRTSGWLWTAAAAAAVALTVATDGGRDGVVAQASGVLRAAYAHLFIFQGSSKPLPPLVHRADRLTIAQAQQHMPFAIVVPAGLPPHTILQYAGVGSEHPVPRVALFYQTQIGGRYYRTIIVETTTVSGPPVAHFEASRKGKDGRLRHETLTVPLRRWKHGDVIMEMLPQGLPATMIDRIVRENTL